MMVMGGWVRVMICDSFCMARRGVYTALKGGCGVCSSKLRAGRDMGGILGPSF